MQVSTAHDHGTWYILEQRSLTQCSRRSHFGAKYIVTEDMHDHAIGYSEQENSTVRHNGVLYDTMRCETTIVVQAKHLVGCSLHSVDVEEIHVIHVIRLLLKNETTGATMTFRVPPFNMMIQTTCIVCTYQVVYKRRGAEFGILGSAPP